MNIYLCKWNLIDGLTLDEKVEYTESMPEFNSNGVLEVSEGIYYLSIVNGSRTLAISMLRKRIESYMKRCIEEHEQMLVDARMAWKECE